MVGTSFMSGRRSRAYCTSTLTFFCSSQSCLVTFSVFQEVKAPSVSPRSMASNPSVEPG